MLNVLEQIYFAFYLQFDFKGFNYIQLIRFFIVFVNKVSELYKNFNTCGKLQLHNFKEILVY